MIKYEWWPEHKPARLYAFEILECRQKEQRLKLLNAVPEEIRLLVKTHVEIMWSKQRQAIKGKI